MVDELDPTKYHVITPKSKKIIIFSLIFTFLVVLPALLFSYYKIAVFRPSQSGKEVTVEIGKGDSAFEIANKLSEKGAINSEFLFVLYLFLNKADTNIQAGTFTIKAGTPLVGVIEQLKHGTNDVSLTFVEGWRVEEFARFASQRLSNVEYKQFVDLASPKEGYLFPDTYFVNKDINEEDLIKLLRDTFDEKTSDILSEGNLKKVGLSKEQVVVIASMVEREVSNIEDRPIIAGILIKRWKDGIKLDVDATTQYVVASDRICGGKEYCIPTLEDFYSLNWWPKDLTKEELENKSPYNTRAVVGLPPSPISSVSRSALESVVNYKETPYYFYMNDRNGVTHYAKTLEEHNSNIQRYLLD